MNWIKKNLQNIFFRYVENKSNSDIETWSTDTVLNEENFYGKSMQKICTKN